MATLFIYWVVTGTVYGSLVEAKSEGEARRISHKYYNGETIIDIHIRRYYKNTIWHTSNSIL